MTADKQSLYKNAWKKWGNLQFIMVVEECAELQKAVTKFLRNRNDDKENHIFEEVADVEIMCEQIRALSPEADRLVSKFKEEKLIRLEGML